MAEPRLKVTLPVAVSEMLDTLSAPVRDAAAALVLACILAALCLVNVAAPPPVLCMVSAFNVLI
jgi:hypothetical protein